MSVASEPDDMVKYQFQVDDEKWEEWKDTVPRSKSLDERIIELIEADTEGRVEAGAVKPTSVSASPETSETQSPPEAELPDLSLPSGVDRDAATEAIRAAVGYIREHDGATMREIVVDVGAEHPLKYDIPDEIKPGERYRGAWWRRVVKPGLEGHTDAQPPGLGQSEWVVKTE
jgi:hypothetical protein